MIGSSNYGDRKNRYKEQGTLIFGKNKKFLFSTKIFASQINDIIRFDGFKNDFQKKEKLSFKDVEYILRQNFKDPIRTLKIKDCMIGQNAKKFDKSDYGNFKEYM